MYKYNVIKRVISEAMTMKVPKNKRMRCRVLMRIQMTTRFCTAEWHTRDVRCSMAACNGYLLLPQQLLTSALSIVHRYTVSVALKPAAGMFAFTL